MNLMMVTFETDLTQFLVEANSPSEAINIAHKLNCSKELLYDPDEMGVPSEKDYSVAEVDFQTLKQIIQRNDWICVNGYDNVIAFSD